MKIDFIDKRGGMLRVCIKKFLAKVRKELRNVGVLPYVSLLAETLSKPQRTARIFAHEQYTAVLIDKIIFKK